MRFKKLTSVLVVGIMICSLAFNAFATSYDAPFSVTSRSSVKYIPASASSRTVTAKASLTSGSGGVWVEIVNQDGQNNASKLFPYQDQSLSPVSSRVSPCVTTNIYVKPHTNNQRVTGSVRCEY